MNTRCNKISPFCSVCAASATLVFGLLAASLDAAVIGHWTFNEGGGTTALDSSGQDNHGTIIGGAESVSAPGGSAVWLDGIDDFVNYGQPAIFDFTSQDFSIEAWIAIDGTQSGNAHGIWGKGAGSYLLGYSRDDVRHNISLCSGSGCGTTLEAFDPSNNPPGNYHHIVFTRQMNAPESSESIVLYIDGVFDRSNSQAVPLFSQAVDVTSGAGTGNHLACMIDEIKIHDIQLTETEVMNSFTAGPSTAASSLPASSEIQVPDVFTTEFRSSRNRRYGLECTGSLVTPTWTSIPAYVIGNGGSMSMSDPTGGPTTKYYRLTVQ